jgi:hypothetical protein
MDFLYNLRVHVVLVVVDLEGVALGEVQRDLFGEVEARLVQKVLLRLGGGCGLAVAEIGLCQIFN